MQLPVLALAIALISFGSAYAADEETEPQENRAHGVWMTDKGRSKVKVGPCQEAQGLCSEIVWLREPNNSRGQPLTDGRNQNVSLRKRPIMGLKILEGLKQIGRYEWEGSVYNPEDGKTYKANLALVKPDMLRLKGCLPMGWPCRSKFWTRTEFEPPAPVVVAEESIEVTAPSGGPGAAPQPQPPAAAQAPAEVQTASRAAPMALTPPQDAPPSGNPEPAPQQMAAIEPSQPAQSAPAAAPKPAPAAPQSQPLAQPAPAAAPRRAPVAPSNRAAPQPSRPTYEPASRAVVAPPPPPPPVVPAQPLPRAYEPPSRTVAVPPAPPPPASVARAQPQRQAAVAAPAAAPPARTAARPPAPPAAAEQQRRPDVYPDVAALPTEPALRRGGGGSNYLVQVAARQDRNEAVAVFNNLRRRYPRLLGNAQPIIKRVNLGELGVWYRVRVGPIEGKAAALSFCNRLKFAGSDCFIRRQ